MKYFGFQKLWGVVRLLKKTRVYPLWFVNDKCSNQCCVLDVECSKSKEPNHPLSPVYPIELMRLPSNQSISNPNRTIFSITAFGRLELEAGTGMVWEKNTVGLAGAGGWSGVRGKYCWAGAGCRTEWITSHATSHLPTSNPRSQHWLIRGSCWILLRCKQPSSSRILV